MRTLAAAVAVVLVAGAAIAASPAEARHHHSRGYGHPGHTRHAWRHHGRRHFAHYRVRHVRTAGHRGEGRRAHGRGSLGFSGLTRVVAHPAGCPRTLFCGCGVSVRAFGRAVRAGGLALAQEWLRRFPAAEPGPDKVAVRRDGHHVVYIERMLAEGVALAYDPNSGRHLTQVHALRLTNYRVVDPRARRVAARS